MSKSRRSGMRRAALRKYSMPWSLSAVNTGSLPPISEGWLHGDMSVNEKKLHHRQLMEHKEDMMLFKRYGMPIFKNRTDDPEAYVDWCIMRDAIIEHMKRAELDYKFGVQLDGFVWMHWRLDYNFYKFVETDVVRGVQRVSYPYASREKAMLRYFHNQIMWHTSVVIPLPPI